MNLRTINWVRPLPFVCCALMTQVLVIACSRIGKVSSEEMVGAADLIVRATADSYEAPPRDSNSWTNGVPDSTVLFKIEEVIKGRSDADHLLLHGYLSNRDDYNDHQSPFKFVRPGGRSGSCFANSYKQHADFLLILKKSSDGFTANWYALGPVNEQLHSSDDPWLEWVRKQVKKTSSAK